MQYTTSPDLFKQMLKMFPFGFHTSNKTLSPLALYMAASTTNWSIASQTVTINNAFTQFVDVADGLLIHAFLN